MEPERTALEKSDEVTVGGNERCFINIVYHFCGTLPCNNYFIILFVQALSERGKENPTSVPWIERVVYLTTRGSQRLESLTYLDRS